MFKKIFMSKIVTPIFLSIVSVSASADYHPNVGDFYYDGLFYADSFFFWNSAGPWEESDSGYEHDLWVHEDTFFTPQCVSWTNLPDGYDDCPTAGVMDANGPVFSFGSFDASSIADDTVYAGGWNFYAHTTGNLTTPFTLFGQENENSCLGIPTIWCMFSIGGHTQELLEGYYLAWQGNPTTVYWSVP